MPGALALHSPSFDCQVCGDKGSLASARTCPTCSTPHHTDCWSYAGGCAIYGCGKRWHRVVPPNPARLQEVARALAGDRTSWRRPARSRATPDVWRPVRPSRAGNRRHWTELMAPVARWGAPAAAILVLGATAYAFLVAMRIPTDLLGWIVWLIVMRHVLRRKLGI